MRSREGRGGELGERTGSWAIMDCICGGERTLEAWRNSSSVRMVERERLICAGSGILLLFVIFVE